MYNLVIFGAPGCGKGTQSAKIKEHYNLHHISTGEMLRDRIARGTELGRLADSYISKGNLVPDEVIIKMLDTELDKPEAANGVIFDGFPRTICQAEALAEMLEKRGAAVNAVIGLEVPDEELTKRLVERGKQSGRSDDNPESIAQRLKVYHSSTHPVCDYYRGRGRYVPIDGTGTIDKIFDQIRTTLDGRN